VLKALLPEFQVSLGKWTAASTEAVVRAHAERTGLKLGKVAQPLRAALTGRSTSPGVFDVLAVLGREESLGRIGDQILDYLSVLDQQIGVERCVIAVQHETGQSTLAPVRAAVQRISGIPERLRRDCFAFDGERKMRRSLQ